MDCSSTLGRITYMLKILILEVDLTLIKNFSSHLYLTFLQRTTFSYDQKSQAAILHGFVCNAVWMALLCVATLCFPENPRPSLLCFPLIHHYLFFIILSNVCLLHNKWRSFCMCACMHSMVTLPSTWSLP